MSHHLVVAEKLTHAYPDGTRALDGISFSIAHGEAVAVVGANGAGKSTLLLHLNGVLLPGSGEMRIGALPVGKATLEAVRRSVGLVFQDPDDQLFMPTVREDVAFGPRNLGLAGPALERVVDEALAQADALHLAAKAPYRLSAGEKKRAALAAVLAMEPDVLALDEPSAGLDPLARRHLIGLLQGFGHTRIFSTHDLDLAWEVASRVLLLKEGRLRADGPAREILADAALLAECRLEPPLSLQACPNCGARPPLPPAGRS